MPRASCFPASSTLPELVIAAFGGDHPEFAYKIYVLVSAAAVPWLIALAGLIWRFRPARPRSPWASPLVYIWTDFPISYAAFGMLPYFLGIPLGLVATGVFARYLTRGGLLNWLAAAGLMSLAVLVHLTTAMIVAPAALLAYIVGVLETVTECFRRPVCPGHSSVAIRAEAAERHLDLECAIVGVWLIPVVVLVVNAFWWLPGLWLWSTKGPSDFAFYHPPKA